MFVTRKNVLGGPGTFLVPATCAGCFCVYGDGDSGVSYLSLDNWPPFGDFSKTPQKWLYVICSILKSLLAFVESTPLLSLQMPRLRGHPGGIRRGNAGAGHRGPLHVHSLEPGPGGPAAAGHHAVCGKVGVAFCCLVGRRLVQFTYWNKTTRPKGKHLVALLMLDICGIDSD